MSSEMEPVTAEQVIQGLRYDWPNKTFGEWELIVPLAPDVFHPEKTTTFGRQSRASR